MKRTWRLLLALVVPLVALLLGFSVGRASGAMIIGVTVLAALVMAAVRRPLPVATLVLAGGALLPDYLGVTLRGTGLTLNGFTAIAVLLSACAVFESRRERQGMLLGALVVPVVFAVLWVAGAALGGTGGVASRLARGMSLGLPGGITAVSAALLSTHAEGRAALMKGIMGGGVLASVYGAVEYLTGRNPLLHLGVSMNAELLKYLSVPLRLGQTRISASFTHPIMLALFLGIAVICVAELRRERRLAPGLAVVLGVMMVLMAFMTISRGPLLALGLVFTLWLALPRMSEGKSRLSILAVAAVALVLGFTAVGGAEAVWSLLRPGYSSEAGTAISYRVHMLNALWHQLDSAPLFGVPTQVGSTFLAGFVSLDNQVAHLLMSRGIVGLFAFGLLAVAPLAVVRKLRPIDGVAITLALYVLVCGGTVAIFGAVQPYVFVALSLALGTRLDTSDIGE